MWVRTRRAAAALLVGFALVGCVSEPVSVEGSAGSVPRWAAEEEESSVQISVTVNDTEFKATLAGNAASIALAELSRERPLVIELIDYGGFEKVGRLGADLPAEDRRITTAPGDIVLYQGNQIVMFYGSNTWSYTPLARIDDLSGWERALGGGDATVAISSEE